MVDDVSVEEQPAAQSSSDGEINPFIAIPIRLRKVGKAKEEQQCQQKKRHLMSIDPVLGADPTAYPAVYSGDGADYRHASSIKWYNTPSQFGDALI